MAGRKGQPGNAKPTVLKIAMGNPGKRPLPKGEPELPGGPVEPPDWLSDRARTVWGRVASVLTEAGILRPADAMLFGVFCSLQAEFEADPVAMTTPRIAQLRILAGCFGLEPSSRSRLNVGEKKQAASEWDDLSA